MTEEQESADAFYWKHGPCCAGCDWWRHVRAGRVGLCTKAAPVASEQRTALLGFDHSSMEIGAGHPLTLRDHHCGEFKDEFEWGDLPLTYRIRIGAPTVRSQ